MKSLLVLPLALLLLTLAITTCKKNKDKDPVVATCTDGILNQGEVQADCGGPCKACATCVDGIKNQGEVGVDCGGPCPACITCSDGIQNQGEENIDCGGPCPLCPITYPNSGKWGSSIIRADSLTILSYDNGNASYYSMRAEVPKGNKVTVQMQNHTVGSNAVWYYYPGGVEGWGIDTYDQANNLQHFTVDATFGHKTCDLQMYFTGTGSATIKVFENNNPNPIRVRNITW